MKTFIKALREYRYYKRKGIKNTFLVFSYETNKYIVFITYSKKFLANNLNYNIIY